MKTKVKRVTVSSMKDKLDAIFSRYIRLRDCLLTTGSTEYGECVTCDNQFEFKKLDAGHFVKRQYNSTRYDERNVNAQCRNCNRFNDGEQYLYGKMIDELYGEGTADELIGMKNQRRKFTVPELEEMYEYYVARVKELEAKQWKI